jgi:hypothetical protein
MHKGFAVSAVLVFMLSSGTFAVIDQTQQFNIGTSSVGVLTGAGTGAMMSVNVIPVTNSQEAIDGSGNIQTVQIGVASLFQGAMAAGLCGVYGFQPDGSAAGQQWQGTNDYFSTGSGSQNVGTALTQNVITIGRYGTASALQSFIGNQTQLILNPYGVNANVQCIGINMFDGIGGAAGTLINRGISINRNGL